MAVELRDDPAATPAADVLLGERHPAPAGHDQQHGLLRDVRQIGEERRGDHAQRTVGGCALAELAEPRAETVASSPIPSTDELASNDGRIARARRGTAFAGGVPRGSPPASMPSPGLPP
ncbi:hypothetical protein AB0K15_41145 [Amycolatopsis sp. NPDC049253]|uniref:hypothetical protein n=1 Tax=Amycolatopsis sp. NPDC049253 TaxID=3155274 RepID=UPI003427B87F